MHRRPNATGFMKVSTKHMTAPVRENRSMLGLSVALTAIVMLLPVPAIAQATSPYAAALGTVVDPEDRTGTNPANLRTTVDLSNEFGSLGDGLFVDQATWRYAQSFAGRRMRAHVELPLSLANVTGRTEAGFGDVVAGWEWVPAVRNRVAWLVGADVSADTATNLSLASQHNILAPSAGLAIVPRRDTVLSVSYAQRLSLESVEDIPDVNEGTLEAAIVHRFGDGTWIRAVPALVIDYRQRETWGRVDAEWGRVLTGGASTWVHGGALIGASRPFDWSLAVGFRFVQ